MINLLVYAETYFIILSIPIIYILYISSLITKEFTKIEKDRYYCESDLMERETLRNYTNTSEYKSLMRNILIASVVFFIITIILFVMIIFLKLPKEINIIMWVILFILAVILVSKSNVNNSSEYSAKITDLNINVGDNLKNLKSFADFPEGFKKPFIERWLSLQNSNELLTSSEIIDAINIDLKSANSVIGFLRPADNYFFQDKDVEYKKDIDYLYNQIGANNSVVLPTLGEYSNITKFNDVIAWLILIFLYYNIFHIYFYDFEMFTEIIITFIIILILFMLLYYITIAKDEL